MIAVSRNDPCPCGSGKKYKKCCLRKESQRSIELDVMSEALTEGVKRMSERQWVEAIAQFKKVENVVSAGFSVTGAIAACYDMLEEFSLAAEYYEKALEAESGPDERFHLIRSVAVANGCAGRVKEAREALERALELTEDAERKKGVVAMLEAVDRILRGKGSPHFFQVQVGLQRAFTDMEDDRYEEALERLEKIKNLEPENAAIFYNLGVVHTWLRKDDQAIADYEEAVRLKPDYWQAWYNLGQICLLKRRDFSRALHCFDRTIAIVPDYVGAHHQKGVAYELLGDNAKAVDWWEKTLILDAGNTQAAENIRRITGQSREVSDSVAK